MGEAAAAGSESSAGGGERPVGRRGDGRRGGGGGVRGGGDEGGAELYGALFESSHEQAASASERSVGGPRLAQGEMEY